MARVCCNAPGCTKATRAKSGFCPAHRPQSWAAEVIADDSGHWAGNALRFATQPEASAYVQGLYMRWTLVRETRVVQSCDPVTHAIVDGILKEVK